MRWGATLAMGVTLLVTATAPPVGAQGETSEQPPGSVMLSAPVAGDVGMNLVLSGNPYNCYGYTDKPHKSRHDPGYAVTLVRTECQVQANRQYAYGEMYRDRWYGLQFLDDAASTTFWTYAKVRAIPKWYCRGTGTYTYRTWGAHSVTIGAIVYTGETYNENRFDC